MKRLAAALPLVASAALVACLAALLLLTRVPLGWPGEWTWSRLDRTIDPNPAGVVLALVAVALYAAFVALIGRRLHAVERRPRRRSIVAALGLLGLASITLQLTTQTAAPQAFGLTKWAFALHSPASNGYYTHARSKLLDNPMRFWREYPEWIRAQDSLHVGTHPPGLFLAWRAALGLMRNNPPLAAFIVEHAPADVTAGFHEIRKREPIPVADRAAMILVGALTWVACALTVVPIFFLARAIGLSNLAGWWAASFWPLVPAAILFQPAADAAYPLIAATAVALALRRSHFAHALAGLSLALGMQITLAFLAIGLLVAIVVSLKKPWKQSLAALSAIGFGFFATTCFFTISSRTNPFEIWWANQHNHARFYVQFHRSYWVWMALNPVESAIALGLPVVVWVLAGLRDPRSHVLTWATLFVLALLQFTGKNLSEVARLWLPFMPLFLPAAALGIERSGGNNSATAATIGLLGVQTLLLQSTIQVVYAVA